MVEELLYVHRNRRLIRDGSPGRPPGLSHSSWALASRQLTDNTDWSRIAYIVVTMLYRDILYIKTISWCSVRRSGDTDDLWYHQLKRGPHTLMTCGVIKWRRENNSTSALQLTLSMHPQNWNQLPSWLTASVNISGSIPGWYEPVSYTHLTLPTNHRV